MRVAAGGLAPALRPGIWPHSLAVPLATTRIGAGSAGLFEEEDAKINAPVAAGTDPAESARRYPESGTPPGDDTADGGQVQRATGPTSGSSGRPGTLPSP